VKVKGGRDLHVWVSECGGGSFWRDYYFIILC